VPELLFVLTNDDAGGQNPDLFRELLDFLAANDVPATFFVVPMANEQPLDEKREWLDLLHQALDQGHELQLHAFDHGSTFEFGVPPGFMLDIIPEAKARWEREPEAIQAGHTLPAMRDKIDRGKDIFHRAIGYEPHGFRGPCLSMSDATYQALVEANFRWSSNLVVNPLGWRYINRDYDAGEPWQADVPPHPFHYKAGITEVPMISEYTWYLREEDLERHYTLIRDDFDRVRQAKGAFVALSHYYAMTGEWATGLEVYKRLIAYARGQGGVRFCTVSQLVESFFES
jgi:peptidoglycan/xylan/chitin deacetylase (PgdA/CDA1 family)